MTAEEWKRSRKSQRALARALANAKAKPAKPAVETRPKSKATPINQTFGDFYQACAQAHWCQRLQNEGCN